MLMILLSQELKHGKARQICFDNALIKVAHLAAAKPQTGCTFVNVLLCKHFIRDIIQSSAGNTKSALNYEQIIHIIKLYKQPHIE